MPDPLLGTWRRRLLSAIIGIVIAWSLFDIVTDTEQWPFSPYQMYAQARQTYTLDLPRLVGVVEGTGEERQLYAFEYIQPFDQARMRDALESLLSRPDHGPLLDAALRDCLSRYEALRRAGAHDGPRLQALRLYRLEWHLDPWARNVEHPDGRTLIAEVRARDAGRP